VSLLAEGLGVIKIGKLLQVSPNTVMAVRDREGVSVDIEKQEIAAVCRKGARLCTEAIVERLNDPIARETIAVRDLAVSAGVLIDKSQVLTGGATARIEHVNSMPEHDDFNSYFEKMKCVEAESIGCGSEGAGQKGVIEAEAVDHKMLCAPGVDQRADTTISCEAQAQAGSDPAQAHEDPRAGHVSTPVEAVSTEV